MKMVTVVETESGVRLLNPNDGFVIYGTIYKGDNTSGLTGSGKEVEILKKEGSEGRAFTNWEMLDLLQIPIVELRKYVNAKEKFDTSSSFTIALQAENCSSKETDLEEPLVVCDSWYS